MNEQLKRAQAQRLIALENAFKTIDAFAIPSLNPEQFDTYHDIKESLFRTYTEGITIEDTKDYKAN